MRDASANVAEKTSANVTMEFTGWLVCEDWTRREVCVGGSEDRWSDAR